MVECGAVSTVRETTMYTAAEEEEEVALPLYNRVEAYRFPIKRTRLSAYGNQYRDPYFSHHPSLVIGQPKYLIFPLTSCGVFKFV